ncbi:hypothetical protein [Pimelobacter simplex]|nr:hypothetical protein [Pimelobacter simplex]UUW94623.1 hypothetical protein M0M48_23220 [Pimelobacter simplex]
MIPATYDEHAARRLERAERRWLADARARLSSRAAHPPRPTTPNRPEADR